MKPTVFLPLLVGSLLLGGVPAQQSNPSEPLEVLREYRGPQGFVNYVLFSADGKRLAATARFDPVVYVWDVESGKVVAKADAGHKIYTTGIAFVDGGKALARDDGTTGHVRVWDAATGKRLREFPYNRGRDHHHAYSSDFSRDGMYFAVADVYGRQSVNLWGVVRGRLVRRFPHPGANACAFSPDGKTLATQSNTGDVRLWDARTGELRRQWQRPTTQPVQVAFCLMEFSPDGKQLAVGGQLAGGVYVYDTVTGREVHRFPGEPVDCAVFTPDSKRFGRNGLARGEAALTFFDLATGKAVGGVRAKGPQAFPEKSVAFSPDGTMLAAGGMDHVRAYGRGRGHELPLFTPLQDTDRRSGKESSKQP